ncbi:hypothetical protein WI697_26420 [Tistrella mobilis]|uniref:hypothetical protein n=1 Tax=Tistrella mobilis TaxID=171437 RepID=UPI0031F7175F
MSSNAIEGMTREFLTALVKRRLHESFMEAKDLGGRSVFSIAAGAVSVVASGVAIAMMARIVENSFYTGTLESSPKFSIEPSSPLQKGRRGRNYFIGPDDIISEHLGDHPDYMSISLAIAKYIELNYDNFMDPNTKSKPKIEIDLINLLIENHVHEDFAVPLAERIYQFISDNAHEISQLHQLPAAAHASTASNAQEADPVAVVQQHFAARGQPVPSWKEARGNGMSAPDFLRTYYQPITLPDGKSIIRADGTGLIRAHFSKLDRELYTWLGQRTTSLPDDLPIPTKKQAVDAWVSRVQRGEAPKPDTLVEYSRFAGAKRRRQHELT